MYLIIRTDNGKREYVSDPNRNGTGQSYSRDLRLAKLFPSREAAELDRCGNESIVALSDEMIG